MTTNKSDVEAMLPWYAVGTLDSREADHVESALAQDPELVRCFAMVRQEMALTIRLNEAIGAPSRRVMEKLLRTIDECE